MCLFIDRVHVLTMQIKPALNTYYLKTWNAYSTSPESIELNQHGTFLTSTACSTSPKLFGFRTFQSPLPALPWPSPEKRKKSGLSNLPIQGLRINSLTYLATVTQSALSQKIVSGNVDNVGCQIFVHPPHLHSLNFKTLA
jgi:hypothetical protein